jgi:hypothetical protein
VREDDVQVATIEKAGEFAGFFVATVLLPARPLVGALVILLSVLLVTASHFVRFGLLLVLGGFLLGLLSFALLLLAGIGAGFRHGSLLV